MHPDHEPRDFEIEALLSHLDHPVPRLTVEEIVARAEARPRQWRAWAAGIALTVMAAGAVYAAPGSPVPDWIGALSNLEGPTEAPVPESAVDLRGLSFAAGETLIVAIAENPESFHLLIRLTDDPEILLQSARADTRFLSEPRRVEVNVAPGDTLEIFVPRQSVGLEVTSGSRALFTWNGTAATTAETPRPDGTYLLPVNPTVR
jgi:hypothetical protein